MKSGDFELGVRDGMDGEVVGIVVIWLEIKLYEN